MKTTSISVKPTTFTESFHETLFNACFSVFKSEGKDLEIWRVAEAVDASEEEVIATLIEATGTIPGSYVTFRYPSLPVAAITDIRKGW